MTEEEITEAIENLSARLLQRETEREIIIKHIKNTLRELDEITEF